MSAAIINVTRLVPVNFQIFIGSVDDNKAKRNKKFVGAF